MEQKNRNLTTSEEKTPVSQDLSEAILVDLKNKKISNEDADLLRRLMVEHGFLDEKGCAICGTLNLEAQIVLRPFIKLQLTYFKKIFLMSELTLCPAHLKKKMFESRIHMNNLIRSVNPLPKQLTDYTTANYTTGIEDNICGFIPLSTCPGGMIPNTASNFESAPNRFRRCTGFASSNFANGSFNSKNYLPGLNNGLRPLNYGIRVDDTKSLEDIPLYNNFGATASSSSPQQQNYFPRPPANPIPFPPLPPLTAKIWSHIDSNVVSPFVTDNFRFAVPNAEEAYLKFRESNTKKTNNCAIGDPLVPGRRMAYTRNFKLEAPENPPQPSTSNSANASSTNGNGVLVETGNARRGKKILGQGIYKK